MTGPCWGWSSRGVCVGVRAHRPDRKSGLGLSPRTVARASGIRKTPSAMAELSKPTGAQADAAVARIRELADSQLSDDEQLKALLEPFRGRRPLRMRCPHTGCRHTIVWCAVHPVIAKVVFSKNGPRKGYVENLLKDGPPRWLQQQPPSPYDYWSLGPSSGADSAKPTTQQPGEHTRWTFKCGKCGRSYTLTDRTLMTHVITALTGNRKEFTP
jgi:hypothetical protein